MAELDICRELDCCDEAQLAQICSDSRTAVCTQMITGRQGDGTGGNRGTLNRKTAFSRLTHSLHIKDRCRCCDLSHLVSRDGGMGVQK